MLFRSGRGGEAVPPHQHARRGSLNSADFGGGHLDGGVEEVSGAALHSQFFPLGDVLLQFLAIVKVGRLGLAFAKQLLRLVVEVRRVFAIALADEFPAPLDPK